MTEAQERSYLFRIATNLLRDRWRRHREEPLADNIVDVGHSPSLDRQLEIRQGIQRLSLRERQLLWLAYVEGASHKEISECTGLRAASVRLLLFRARHRLANLIRAASGVRHEVPK